MAWRFSVYVHEKVFPQTPQVGTSSITFPKESWKKTEGSEWWCVLDGGMREVVKEEVSWEGPAPEEDEGDREKE